MLNRPLAILLLCTSMTVVDLCVLAIDLWGRGYSDTPLDVPHDSRLFSTQILFAIASSPLSWTGTTSGFSLIGFSLGGGIAMSFAAHFPYLVHSIVLLAPAGVLRYLPDSYTSLFFRYSFLVPSRYLRQAVATLLGVTLSNQAVPENVGRSGGDGIAKGARKATEKADLNVPAIVQWQFDFHKGFYYSFVDTIAFGPIINQHGDWRKVCEVMKGNEPSSPSDPERHRVSRLQKSKLLVIFGDADDIVVADDVSKDLNDLFGGPEHVDIKVVSGGHGFPVPDCDEVFEHIRQSWHI